MKEAKDLISSEPTLLEVRLPVLIVGDVHGQFKDLRRIFTSTGNPGAHGAHTHRYLFLGGLCPCSLLSSSFRLQTTSTVERTRWSASSFSWPTNWPSRAWFVVERRTAGHSFCIQYNLLRGNHESGPINRVYGFYQELKERFTEPEAEQLWRAFNDLFAYLPLAALVQKRILCMHGGVSAHLNSLDDIRNVRVLSYARLTISFRSNVRSKIPAPSRWPAIFCGPIRWSIWPATNRTPSAA